LRAKSRSTLDWLRQWWALWALVIGSALLVIGAIVLAGAPPGKTLGDLVASSLGDASAISSTLKEVTPLLISGIAVFLALKAGLFNIGVEGQITVGALASAMVSLRFPGAAGMFLGVVAGMMMGGLWALPAALIKAYKGGHEVITTIMLNNVAMLLTTALVAGPWRDRSQESPTTASLSENTHLPSLLQIGNLEISSGLAVGIFVALGLWWWLKRTVAGYELQAVGANSIAAKFAGINNAAVLVKAMTWSGALGGLAGAIQVLAIEHRFYPSMASGYGFDGLGVALLAGGTPLGLLPSSVLFGALNKGGTTIQVLDQVPKGITTVILGLLIVIAAAIRFRKAGASRA
jgi:general nucleoside transport system permease protein